MNPSKLTLREFRKAVLADWRWQEQRGPNDVQGHARDVETANAVRRARTWAEMADAVPFRWQSAAANRCLPSQV